jgi:hypothetical protein
MPDVDTTSVPPTFPASFPLTELAERSIADRALADERQRVAAIHDRN